MCSLQLLLPRAERWYGTGVVYVKAVVNRTWKEDVVFIEEGKDRCLQRCCLVHGQVNGISFDFK